MPRAAGWPQEEMPAAASMRPAPSPMTRFGVESPPTLPPAAPSREEAEPCARGARGVLPDRCCLLSSVQCLYEKLARAMELCLRRPGSDPELRCDLLVFVPLDL